MENRARGFGKGGRSPAIDDAFRQMAKETGMEPTLENLKRYRAMKELEQMSKLTGSPTWGTMIKQAGRLRLDPALQALIPYLENAGSLGAVSGEVDRTKQLPPTADEATLDQIRRALQP
jgi:hypothetical protein